MKHIKILQRLIIFAVLCALLFSPTLAVGAQEPQTITGTGTIDDLFPLTITFAPAGGPVTGSSFYQVDISLFGAVCSLTISITMSGTFAGGDGGAASGTLLYKDIVDELAGSGCVIGTHEYNGTWSGNFYANGAGDGTMEIVLQDGVSDLPWQVTYSPEEFQAALSTPITSEYIYNTYGIRVEDSFGDDKYDQKAWSEHELSLLNEVLQELPPDLLKNMALTRIVRNKAYIDANGNPDPDTFGSYLSCDKKTDADCTGSSATIRIYDHASSPFDFTNDPTGDIQFKATILHEMIHALQYRRDKYSVYDNPYSSTLMENYMDATRPNTAIDAGINRNGWAWYGNQVGWKGYYELSNLPPTQYGYNVNPLEDMSESVMMYVYDPQKLKASSMQRYNFIRDQMFGGTEYENGVQKKP